MSWSPGDIPDLSGRTALVTGVSVGGLGYFTALELARAGARVVLAGRNPDKLTETGEAIHDELPDAPLEPLVIDLADLSSVRSGAAAARTFGPLDLLVNNAGIMATPYRRTVDGLESQLATNHFGPFLLTGLLLPQLSDDARVVTVSSQMHRVAHTPPLADPRVKPRPYLRWIAYSQTKLANLLFTFELDRRLRAAGAATAALAAHPGGARTKLGRDGGNWTNRLLPLFAPFEQPASVGSLGLVRAATDPAAQGGEYYGPKLQIWGPPVRERPGRSARDPEAAVSLWEQSEELTGCRSRFDVEDGPRSR